MTVVPASSPSFNSTIPAACSLLALQASSPLPTNHAAAAAAKSGDGRISRALSPVSSMGHAHQQPAVASLTPPATPPTSHARGSNGGGEVGHVAAGATGHGVRLGGDAAIGGAGGSGTMTPLSSATTAPHSSSTSSPASHRRPSFWQTVLSSPSDDGNVNVHVNIEAPPQPRRETKEAVATNDNALDVSKSNTPTAAATAAAGAASISPVGLSPLFARSPPIVVPAQLQHQHQHQYQQQTQQDQQQQISQGDGEENVSAGTSSADARMNIPCVVCGVRFRKPGHLNMHWRSVHARQQHPPFGVSSLSSPSSLSLSPAHARVSTASAATISAPQLAPQRLVAPDAYIHCAAPPQPFVSTSLYVQPSAKPYPSTTTTTTTTATTTTANATTTSTPANGLTPITPNVTSFGAPTGMPLVNGNRVSALPCAQAGGAPQTIYNNNMRNTSCSRTNNGIPNNGVVSQRMMTPSATYMGQAQYKQEQALITRCSSPTSTSTLPPPTTPPGVYNGNTNGNIGCGVASKGCAKVARAYACPQCDASFRRGSDRNRHMRMVHAKIRPFECALCGNHFGRKSFLEAHVLTVHHKLRPYRCDCGAAFGQRSSLTRHARKIHGREPS